MAASSVRTWYARFVVPITLLASTTIPANASVSASASAPPPVPAPVVAPAPDGPSVIPLLERPSAHLAPVAACSFVAPVCVHAAPSVPEGSILRVLASAEHAYRALIALGLPLPLSDYNLGGDSRYDIYLVDEKVGPITVADSIATGGAWDVSSAFSVLPPPDASDGCEVDATLVRLLVHASALRLDAGVEPSAVAMAGGVVASAIVDCDEVELPAIDDFQRAPERSLFYGTYGTYGTLPNEPTGAWLFARYLDDTYGSTAVPGSVLFGLLAVAGQRTPPSALHFQNEPDLLDALRKNLRVREKPFEDMLLDFAVSRAFVGSRSDGVHLSDVDRFGDMGRVRFEWAVGYDSLPRRLAPVRPIEATGATYLWLDLRGAPDDLELTFVADWELGVFFHWTLVKVDPSGVDVGRISVAGINGASHAERSIRDLKNLGGLVVVGVNTGSIDRSHPVDPDEGPELARSYTVTLFR